MNMQIIIKTDDSMDGTQDHFAQCQKRGVETSREDGKVAHLAVCAKQVLSRTVQCLNMA